MTFLLLDNAYHRRAINLDHVLTFEVVSGNGQCMVVAEITTTITQIDGSQLLIENFPTEDDAVAFHSALLFLLTLDQTRLIKVSDVEREVKVVAEMKAQRNK